MGKNNNEVNEKTKEKLSIPTMLICVIGAVLVGLGAMLLRSSNFKLNIIPAKGTISSTQMATDANGNEVSSIVISYTANNSGYNATIIDDIDKYELGGKIILYHDFFKPENVSLKPTGYFGYLSLIIGIIFLVLKGPRFYRIIRDNYIL